MVGYLPRALDLELDELLVGTAALAIEGPKGVGKTATASRRARTIIRLDDLAERQAFEADPRRALAQPFPILLDEWQRSPTSWDAVRREVDDDRTPGRFLLTGSAAPADVARHSGAGRIVTTRMRPMALAERLVADPTVSLAAVLSGVRPPVDGHTGVDVAHYVHELLDSGFPGLRGLAGRASRVALDSYLDLIVEKDFADLGQQVRRPATLRSWMRAYAAATSTTASYETIRDAATSGDRDKPARSTTLPYRETLQQLWIVEPVPAWSPGGTALRRLTLAPKHQLADPALAARLLGIDGQSLIAGRAGRNLTPTARHGATLLGALFESLVTLCVRVHGQAAESRVSHLRTRAGDHEVDLIVERGDGAVVAVEVKVGREVSDSDVTHLRWLAGQLGSDLLDAIVISTGPRAYRRPDGIAVVPLALLGP